MNTLLQPHDDVTTLAGLPVIVSHERGHECGARIRSHVVRTDQPLKHGGDDGAPTPLELLSAALGSCITLYVHKFLDARDLPTEGLRVEVSQWTARNPARVASFDVRMILPPDVPSRYLPMLEAVARTCPVHNTLAYGAAISLAIETQATERIVPAEPY